jgi:aldehyde dehydrogenase (NAD+)
MENIEAILKKQRAFFATGKTRDLDFRLRQLDRLHKTIQRHEVEILEALKKDLNKSDYEGYMTEVGMVYEELRFVRKHLKRWARPKLVQTPVVQFPSVSRVYTEPYGAVLIMAPWNYPFQLALEPFIGSIAAGNCAVIKPSAYSPNTSKVIEQIIKDAFPASYAFVVQGGREANQSLLKEKFDFIFFTGSPGVGRVVMEAASQYLTPVCLELGGKSPCIVEETADLRLAAKRIVWGKFLNAGQTCVAPDYLLVQDTIQDELLGYIKRYIRQFYGEHPCMNPNYPRIVNEKHFNRLLSLMDCGEIIHGGGSHEESLRIEPTVLTQVSWDSPVMAEEIFGPIFPVITYHDLREAVTEINKRPKPLALYLFTNNKKQEQYVLKMVSHGGGCINDTIVHLATSHMPFGGVGESGMGSYHGKASYATFSHKKGVLKKSNLLDIPLRYPPYRKKLSLLRKIM